MQEALDHPPAAWAEHNEGHPADPRIARASSSNTS